VLKVRSDLVLVDVVVTKNGVPVKGLTEDKFRVLENGKPQELKVFEAHTEAEQAPTADAASSSVTSTNPPGPKAPALPPNTYSDFTPTPPSSAINVLLLDALNTQSTDQGNVRKQMLEYLKKIPPGTQMAVLTLSSQLRMVQGFTADASLLAKAIADKDAITRSMAEDKSSSNEMREEVVSNLVTAGLMDDAIEMQQFAADMKSFDTDHQEEMTLAALRQIAHYLSAIPGRKNLIWFSGSFPLYIDPVAFDTAMVFNGKPMKDSMTGDQVKDACNPNPSRTIRDYAAQVRETDRQLTAARIAVYPVDAKGLLRGGSYDASANQAASLCLAVALSPTAQARQVGHAESQAEDESRLGDTTLQQVAAETGGKAFVNTNGFQDAIRQALTDGANYYTIGYMPQGKDDGQFRHIKVNVNGGYQLEYRDGYYADSAGHGADSGASTMKEAVQFGAPPPSEIPFKVRVIPSSDPAAKGFTPSAGPAGADAKALKPPVTRYLIDYMVDAHRFAFQKTPDGVEHARLEFTVLAYDADGKVINVTGHGFDLDLTPEAYAKVMSGGFPEHQEMDLPAGQVFLRIVVRDLASTRAGATEVPLIVAKN